MTLMITNVRTPRPQHTQRGTRHTDWKDEYGCAGKRDDGLTTSCATAFDRGVHTHEGTSLGVANVEFVANVI